MSNIKIPVFGGCRLRDPFGFSRNEMMLALLMMMGNTYQISRECITEPTPDKLNSLCCRNVKESQDGKKKTTKIKSRIIWISSVMLPFLCCLLEFLKWERNRNAWQYILTIYLSTCEYVYQSNVLNKGSEWMEKEGGGLVNNEYKKFH